MIAGIWRDTSGADKGTLEYTRNGLERCDDVTASDSAYSVFPIKSESTNGSSLANSGMSNHDRR